jgi:hypothetical protein
MGQVRLEKILHHEPGRKSSLPVQILYQSVGLIETAFGNLVANKLEMARVYKSR